MADCRLYICTPPALDPAEFAPKLEQALDAGDVACLQLRLKDVDDDTVRRAIDVLRPITQSRDVAFILNDRPDLAAETGCDGVHVGQSDWPYAKARKAVGPNAIVGVTCHDSRHLAMEAAEAGADYVAFGAFYPDDDQALQLPARAGIAGVVVRNHGSPLRRHRRNHRRKLRPAGQSRRRFHLRRHGGMEPRARPRRRSEGAERRDRSGIPIIKRQPRKS